MRTIGTTFSTREEAERAGRDLQSLGVAAERIMLKDLAENRDPDGGSGTVQADRPAEGFFLSAKVEPDQVTDATRILKGSSDAVRPADPLTASPTTAARPLPRDHVRFEDEPVRKPVKLDLRPGVRTTPQDDWTWWGRRLVMIGLIVLAAFVAGAVLGLVT
jgi:hypothetical protein